MFYFSMLPGDKPGDEYKFQQLCDISLSNPIEQHCEMLEKYNEMNDNLSSVAFPLSSGSVIDENYIYFIDQKSNLEPFYNGEIDEDSKFLDEIRFIRVNLNDYNDIETTTIDFWKRELNLSIMETNAKAYGDQSNDIMLSDNKIYYLSMNVLYEIDLENSTTRTVDGSSFAKNSLQFKLTKTGIYYLSYNNGYYIEKVDFNGTQISVDKLNGIDDSLEIIDFMVLDKQ